MCVCGRRGIATAALGARPRTRRTDGGLGRRRARRMELRGTAHDGRPRDAELRSHNTPPQLTARHKQGTIFTEGREGALQIELAVRSHGIACASSMLDIAAACAQSRETRFVCDHNLYFMCVCTLYLYDLARGCVHGGRRGARDRRI